VLGFDEFFADHYGRVVASLTLGLGDRALAEEAAQEAFVVALRRWGTVAYSQRPAAWVYVVAMRFARRQLRRRESRKEIRVMPLDVDPAQSLSDRLTLRDALALLPARQRQAVVLRYLADLAVADVARAMGCKEGTVKSTLHSALASLRVDLVDVVASEGDHDAC